MTTIVPNSAVTEVNPSPNFTAGRLVRIGGIIIHHYGNLGISHDAAIKTLKSQNAGGRVSAHYVVSAGRVTQLVSDRDVAWHCLGNNAGTIGIECKPEASAGDIETLANLIAAIWSEHGYLPLSGHRDHLATACPGRYYPQLGAIEARARAIAGGAPSDVTRASAPAPSSERVVNGLAIDGFWGPATTRRLQEVLGTPVDGEIWGQWEGHRGILAAATGGWQWTDNAPGSTVIRALQMKLGVEADGIMGPATINALEAHYGFTPDGHLDAPSNTVAFLQTALSEGRF